MNVDLDIQATPNRSQCSDTVAAHVLFYPEFFIYLFFFKDVYFISKHPRSEVSCSNNRHV